MANQEAECSFSLDEKISSRPGNTTSVERKKTWSIFQMWHIYCKMFSILIETCYGKFARFTAKRPFAVLFGSLFIAILLAAGFLRIHIESSARFLFLPEDSQASKDLITAAKNGFELDVRQEEVIILPKEGKRVLSRDCLSEMIDVHFAIVQTDGYEKNCFQSEGSGNCISINLLEIFDYDKTKLDNISKRIQTVLKNTSYLMSNGRRLIDNQFVIFDRRRKNIGKTSALRMVYFMTEHKKGNKRENILQWEKKFIETISLFSKTTRCANVYFAAERSLDDSVSESTGSDIKLFVITLIVMAIYSSIVNGRCFDLRYGHQLLGFASLLAIFLGIASAFGFSMYVGVPFVSMVGVLPFLVVSIGVDDVFIILHELNEIIRNGNTPAVNTLIGCMARSGPTITMTTLTDLVAFAVSSRSAFPAVRYFCAYAALAITFAFLLLVTFFVACIWFDIERINALRLDFIPCFKTRTSPDKNGRTNRQHFSFLNNFMKSWAKMLMTGPGKAIVCILSFVLLAGGIYGAVNVNQEFNRKLLTTKGSDYKKFLTVYEEHFSLQFAVSVIVPGQLDYSSPEVQQKYLDLENIAKSNKYFTPVTLSWMPKFLHWAEANKALTNESRYFYSSLQRFLALPEYSTFVQDIRFSKSKNQTRIASSRIVAFSKSSPSSVFRRDMTSSIRSDLSQHSSLNVFPITLAFIYFDQYARILDETIQNLLKAGIAILVVTLVFLSHPMAVLVLLFGFVALIFELFGLMYIWDVSLNSITMITLVMALGFSVDYSAHVAYHFISSDAISSELRIVDSLETIGGSVLFGGVSTFLGMLATGFASSVTFQIFFKMFMGIVIFGLMHGLVILPVYLSLLAKLFDFQHATSYIDYLKNRKPRKLACNTKNVENQAIFKQSQVRKHNPVAVIGISCRFAQKVNSKDEFWTMLVEGNCGIGPFPKNRLEGMDANNSPGLVLGALTGAYMDNLSGFDAEFFGISPAECRALDPQQKLLLQVVYEAIEDAGLRLEDLQQCQTGVYVSLMKVDGYGRPLPEDTAKLAEVASTGCTASTAANRISLLLNLTGPSLTVDTACSSPLTALNTAITHLNTSECEVAIVCASNIILSRVLANDGRCKGVGYGRGEGIAAVILKETSVALLDRDDAYAEIVACGLDNDGQNAIPKSTPSVEIVACGLDNDGQNAIPRTTPSAEVVACGLDNDGQNAIPRTTPSAEIVACGLDNDGQNAIPLTAVSNEKKSELPRRVLLESGLSKEDVQYIEVHGTGTAIGDVVEMQSVCDVYGNSSARVLRVGSVKPNINQTESVAGLAGLIKVCLMVKNGYFVPTINVEESEPELKIPEREMMVQVKYEQWKKDNNRPRTAAVCCYGYGGANAIIREIVQMPAPVIPGENRANRIVTLSARSAVALKMMAKRFSTWIEMRTDDDELPDLVDDICYTLNDRRTVHSHRLAVTFRQLKQAATVMKMFGEDKPGWQNKFISVRETNSAAKKLAFIYGGQGNRWYGMAREMIEQEPKFRESIEKIDDVLRSLGVPWCLMEEMKKSENVSRMQEDPIGQTAVFAIHYSMTELLKYWEILPDAVVGHSLGEISAACTANVLTLKEALELVLLRSRLHESCSATHRMVAIGMSIDEATALIEGLELDDRVNVVVINSPKNVVLSGNAESMQAIETHVQHHHANVLWKALGTTRAFHSKKMEEIKHLFMKDFERLKIAAGREKVAFYSTVTGTQLPGRVLSSADHWWKNVQQPVLFCSAIEKMISDGYKLLVEFNATPQLARHVHDIFSCCQKKATPESEVSVITTLPKRTVKEQHMSFLHNCPATLFTRGYLISWDKIQGSGSKSFIRCPTYPWQEEKFSYRESGPPDILAATKQILDGESRGHPLLGKSVSTEAFSGLRAWESEIDLYSVAYLKDHVSRDSDHFVIPAAFYVEMGLALILHMFPDVVPRLSDIQFNNFLTFSATDVIKFRTRLDMNGSCEAGQRNYQITAVDGNGNEILVSEGGAPISDDVQKNTTVCATTLSLEKIDAIKSRLDKNPRTEAFNKDRTKTLITESWCSDTEALCTVSLTDEIRGSSSSYVAHPSIIDACLQSVFLLEQLVDSPVPYRVGEITVLQRNFNELMFCHVKTTANEGEQTYDIVLADCQGNVVLFIKQFVVVELSNLPPNQVLRVVAYHMQWSQETADPVEEVGSKTNKGLIINDILKQTEDFEKETQVYANSDSQQQSISHSNVFNKSSPSNSQSVFSGLGMENVNIATKVIPLYAPDDAVVKVFMIDGSHQSALANSPFAAGFQHQTKVSLYSIGVDDNGCKTLDYGSVRDLAKQYVKLIKAQQLTGPYYLAGFSFGGTLSFEVASQLIEQKEEVAMLVMLDTLGWLPKSLTHTRQLFTNYQELLIKDLQQTASKHLLKKLGTSRLGYTSEKFGQLIDELGMGEQLFSVMETRAKEQNITLDDLRNHVRTLEQQIKRAALAQLDWQPPKIHYQKTITYLRCQDSFERKPPPFVWSATDSWKCLTKEIDIFSVAGSHFDLPDQPYAKTCGSLIMTTASIAHRTQHNSFQNTGQRSRHEERLVDWLKQAVDIGYSSGDILNFKPGKLWLHENEISLTIWFTSCGLGKQRVINVTDIHNVVPGKYIYALRKKSSGKQDLSLTFSLIAGQNKLYHVRCLDWQQRDKLMGAFQVLLGTPILKFD